MDSLGELLENVGVFEIRIFCANKLNANIYNFPSILCMLENQKMSDVIEFENFIIHERSSNLYKRIESSNRTKELAEKGKYIQFSISFI